MSGAWASARCPEAVARNGRGTRVAARAPVWMGRGRTGPGVAAVASASGSSSRIVPGRRRVLAVAGGEGDRSQPGLEEPPGQDHERDQRYRRDGPRGAEVDRFDDRRALLV